MPRKVLSASQIITISKLFDQHLSKEGCPEGKCRYTNSTNDYTIATELGVGAEAVARLRRNLWGDFHYPEARAKANRHEATLRISALTSELAMALKYMADKLGEAEVAKKAHQIAQDLTWADD